MRLLTYWILLISITAGFSNANAQATSRDSVKATFEAYREAVLAEDDQAALAQIDRNTLAYYQEIRDHAVASDSQTVTKLPLIDRVMVFMMRQRTLPDELVAMDGAGLFRYAVRQGMIDKEGTEKQALGEISIMGGLAKAQIVQEGIPKTEFFTFRRQDQIWKLDLVPILERAGKGMGQTIRQYQLDENEFIFNVLKFGLEEDLKENLWQPIDPHN